MSGRAPGVLPHVHTGCRSLDGATAVQSLHQPVQTHGARPQPASSGPARRMRECRGSGALTGEVSLLWKGGLGKCVHTSEQRGGWQAAPSPIQVPSPSVATCATAHGRMNSGSGGAGATKLRGLRQPHPGGAQRPLLKPSAPQGIVGPVLPDEAHPHAASGPGSADHIEVSLPTRDGPPVSVFRHRRAVRALCLLRDGGGHTSLH